MLWPHTKTRVRADAGYELLFGMLDLSLVKHKVSITTAYPTYQLLLYLENCTNHSYMNV